MGKDTEIQWCTHTFNPWRGCTKVSPGCANCYAEAMAKRNPKVLGVWGDHGTRVVAAEAGWAEVLKWDRKAREAGERHRVFCASFADVFEDWQGPMVDSKGNILGTWCGAWPWTLRGDSQPPKNGWRPLTMEDVRRRIARLVWDTQNLDWLFLTKRIENAKEMLYRMWFPDAEWPKNVWLGTTVEDQEEADKRIPILLGTPAKVRFLSVEPLLGPMDLSKWLEPIKEGQEFFDHLSAIFANVLEEPVQTVPFRNDIHWVIVGGESGPKARPCDIAWIRSIVAQCKAAGVACFIKQLGSHVITRNDELGEWPEPFGHDESERYQGAPIRMRLRDSHGGDPSEWPEDLRVREMPGV